MARKITSLTSLVNSIQNSVQGLVDTLQNNSGGGANYPNDDSIKPVLSFPDGIDGSNWNKLIFPYTFSIVNVEGSGAANPFGDFPLPLAPQSINQTETPAVSIRPTQGGTTVTHSGNRYKTLNIKGTTGIAPFRGAAGVLNSTGVAIMQPDELKFKSGYEVFLTLRNWFKAYYEYKKNNGSQAANLRLVFKNYKDGEFLVVELISFTMDRQAGRPFLYDYAIEFRVISHLSFNKANSEMIQVIENNINLAIEKLDYARGVFLQGQEILRQIEGTYNSLVLQPLTKIALAAKAAQGVGTLAGDISSRILRETLTTADIVSFMSEVKKLQVENKISGTLSEGLASAFIPADIEAAAKTQGVDLILNLGSGLMELPSSYFPEATLNALEAEFEAASNLPRAYYENLVEEMQRIRMNLEDFINLGSSFYDKLFDRQDTLSAGVTKTETDAEFDVLYGLSESILAVRLILSTNDLFKSTYNDLIEDMIDRFDGQLNLQKSDAASEYIVQSGQTLEKIAQVELGDSERWGEIAELNGLEYPYITDDFSYPNPKVARPGTKLLVPSPHIYGFSSLPEGKESPLTKNMSSIEKSLGVDFKIDKNYDLVISPTGDLELVAGVENLAQQVPLKLAYEKGEVMRYTDLGANLIIGLKAPEVQELKDGIVNSLLQDSRISNVNDLSIIRQGSTYFISFNIKVKQVDIPIPIKLQIQ